MQNKKFMFGVCGMLIMLVGVARADVASTEYFSAGNNVDITDGVISVPTATETQVGVSVLGTIPAGTEKTETASIWVE